MRECNIMKDLLPLYVEELCSEDSKEYVEEHLKSCQECKKSFEYLKYSEVCVKTVEKKEINAFQKLERYISARIMISYFLFLVVVVIGMGILLCTVPDTPGEMYYVLMPLTMLATGLVFKNVPIAENVGKEGYGRVWVQLLIVCGSSAMMFYMMHAVKINVIPFGIPPYKVGLIISNTLRAGILLSLVMFIFHLYRVGQKKVRYSVWCNLSILCMFMNLFYDRFLYNMSDWQTAMEYLVRNTVGLFVVYVAMTLVMLVKKGDIKTSA